MATALKVNPSNVRATIALGEVKRALGDTEAAIACWLRVEHQNPQYLPMIAERLMQAYTSARREAEGAKVLLDYIEKYPLNDLLDVAFKYISALHGSDAAHILARTQMEKSPNLSGMIRLFDLQIAIAEEPRRRELEMMRNLVFQRTKNLPRYTCQTCGYRTRLFYWRCLGCSGWETYAPRRIEPLLARSA